MENTNIPVCLKLTDVNELRSICKTFKSGKAITYPGIDNIPIHVMKNCFDLIVEPLVKLVNLLLTTGAFPDKLRMAKVTPMFKTGDDSIRFRYKLQTNLPANTFF